MPKNFEFPENQKLWMALGPLSAQDPRDARGLFAVARLKPGVTRAQATSDVAAVANRLAAAYPATNTGWGGSRAKPARSVCARRRHARDRLDDGGRYIGAAHRLFKRSQPAALARGCSSPRDCRAHALGAGRRRLMRQLLTESLVLSLVSLPVGILIAELGTRWIASQIPRNEVTRVHPVERGLANPRLRRSRRRSHRDRLRMVPRAAVVAGRTCTSRSRREAAATARAGRLSEARSSSRRCRWRWSRWWVRWRSCARS